MPQNNVIKLNSVFYLPRKTKSSWKSIYFEILRGNSSAVVDDLYGVEAVVFQRNLDAGGAGVEAVLNELLHGGGEV